jgi:hypothetical protein
VLLPYKEEAAGCNLPDHDKSSFSSSFPFASGRPHRDLFFPFFDSILSTTPAGLVRGSHSHNLKTYTSLYTCSVVLHPPSFSLFLLPCRPLLTAPCLQDRLVGSICQIIPTQMSSKAFLFCKTFSLRLFLLPSHSFKAVSLFFTYYFVLFRPDKVEAVTLYHVVFYSFICSAFCTSQSCHISGAAALNSCSSLLMLHYMHMMSQCRYFALKSPSTKQDPRSHVFHIAVSFPPPSTRYLLRLFCFSHLSLPQISSLFHLPRPHSP